MSSSSARDASLAASSLLNRCTSSSGVAAIPISTHTPLRTPHFSATLMFPCNSPYEPHKLPFRARSKFGGETNRMAYFTLTCGQLWRCGVLNRLRRRRRLCRLIHHRVHRRARVPVVRRGGDRRRPLCAARLHRLHLLARRPPSLHRLYPRRRRCPLALRPASAAAAALRRSCSRQQGGADPSAGCLADHMLGFRRFLCSPASLSFVGRTSVGRVTGSGLLRRIRWLRWLRDSRELLLIIRPLRCRPRCLLLRSLCTADTPPSSGSVGA